MNQYNKMIRMVLDHGLEINDRTGVGTKRLLNLQFSFTHANDTFPLITTRKMSINSIIAETTGFIRGYTDQRDFEALGFKHWETNLKDARWQKTLAANGFPDTYLGRIYGYQWRKWTGNNVTYDQLKHLILSIRTNPYSRRHMLSTWNVGDLDKMCLPPCVLTHQFHVEQNGTYLHVTVNQRSSDLIVGFPHDVAQSSLLLLFVCALTGKKPGGIHFSIGDGHIYKNHIERAEVMLDRYIDKPLPTFNATPIHTGDRQLVHILDNANFNWFSLLNYEPNEKYIFNVNN